MENIGYVFERWDECCGCSSCLAVCPISAISMKPDKYGFLYPIVDQNKCIGCKMCIQVCQVIHV